jgi:glycosyltransferase involved in cell wall biosynthesis
VSHNRRPLQGVDRTVIDAFAVSAHLLIMTCISKQQTRIIHVSFSDVSGGAARAAYRLHRALLSEGALSRMLVRRKQSDDSTVQAFGPKWYQHLDPLRIALARRLLRWQRSPNPIQHSLNVIPSGLPRQLNRYTCCVVNLHWLGNETLSIREIAQIRPPIVWTLHDMWPFCGAEHYDDLEQSERYVRGYTAETRPAGHRGLDLDRWVWQRKRHLLSSKSLTFVAPSRWIAERVRQSALFAKHRVEVIPNALDPARFRPVDRREARRILGIDPDRRVIVFGSLFGIRDRRKGFHLLVPALQALAAKGHAETLNVLIFGMNEPRDPPSLGLRTHFSGRLSDDISLSVIYSAGDVMVVPSMQENLPQTAVEALSCGTPVVGFDGTGLSDIVDHGINGYLAKQGVPDDLRRGIEWVLDGHDEAQTLAVAARRKAKAAFAPNVIANRYLTLYKELLDKSKYEPPLQ